MSFDDFDVPNAEWWVLIKEILIMILIKKKITTFAYLPYFFLSLTKRDELQAEMCTPKRYKNT